MLRRTCEIKNMTWDTDVILSAGLLKALFPDLKIKFIEAIYSNSASVWKLGQDTFVNILYDYGLDDLNTSLVFYYENLNKFKDLIENMNPYSSLLEEWKKHFLNIVDMTQNYFKSTLYNLTNLHDCKSLFERAVENHEPFIVVKDSCTPWRLFAWKYPQVKFVINDRTDFYENRDDHIYGYGFISRLKNRNDFWTVETIPNEDGNARIPIYYCVNGKGIHVKNSNPSFDKFLPYLPKENPEIWREHDDFGMPTLDISIQFIHNMVNKYRDHEKGLNE